jgi:holo-[acyl-carrier protein] synthase
MTRGIGNDIVEIERIRGSISRYGQHFLNRLFTQEEQDYCYTFQDPIPHFAGRFAAKEAIAKALGTGFGAHFSWHDVEIINDALGKPIVKMHSKAAEKFNHPQILISISHSQTHAIAIALWS